MRKITQPKSILTGIAIVLLIVLLAVLVWSAFRMKDVDFEITLTAEETLTLDKIRTSSMSEGEFQVYVSQLEEEDQNYILETLKGEIPYFLQSYGVNAYWFEEEHIHELYETIARYEQAKSSEYDDHSWYDTMEPYFTTTIPSENSTQEEFMEYINSYFDEIGYIARFVEFYGNGDIVTYLAYDWGRVMKISFMRSQKVSEEMFGIDEWNESEYYVMLCSSFPAIALDSRIDTELVGTSLGFGSSELYTTKDGKYMMFYEELSSGELLEEEELLIIEAFTQ